jgi:hypothetical protein
MIKKLRLENFRGVRTGQLELDKLTILVGPNNSGKTTILEALFLAPNPFRQVPYVPSTAAQLLPELHNHPQTEGYHFLLNRYVARKAVIDCDGKEIIFLNQKGSGKIWVYTNDVMLGMNSTTIDGLTLYDVGYLGYNSDEVVGRSDVFILPNSLLFSTKLVSRAREYLRSKWIEIVNTGATAMIAKDVSRLVNDEYVDLTLEPVGRDFFSLFVMLSDGTRVKLSDLGSGVHLHMVNGLLYEHYRPEVLLWDDLETHFNPRLLSRVAEWFADLVEEGKQVVVSTHSLEAVETVTTFVEDATVLLTSLKDGELRTRTIKPDELEGLKGLGVDPRMAETFLL